MRIILFIVFSIASYVARLAVGGDIAKTMPGSSMKNIFKQKSEAIGSRVSEIPVDDGTIQMINKRSRQSLLRNRINGSPQSRKILNGNLARVKRSLRERKKYAKTACRQNDHADDVDEVGTSSNVARFPSWQVSESAVAAINLDSTTNPTVETEMINWSSPAFKRPPSRLENLHYDRPLSEAVPPIAERYANSRGLFDTSASNLMLPKIANPKSKVKFDVRSSAFDGSNKMLSPAYHPKIPAGIESPNSNRPQGFQRRYNEYRKDFSNPYNVKEELPNDHPTGSNKRFLLVPVSKDLYVLKNIRESPTGVDGMIIPKQYKLLERDKDNATSAILSFKAHMHHDVKDVGRAYLQRGIGNHRSFDHNANYLYPTLESRIPEENASPTENLLPPSYPNFLYPGIAFQTRPNLIDAVPEMSDKQTVSPVPGYDNISSTDSNINTDDGTNSYGSPAFLSSFPLDISNYDVPLYSKESRNDGQPPNILPAIKLDDAINPFQRDSGDYGSSLEYSEFGVKSTTLDFRDIFGTIDDDTYTPVTLENVGVYLTNDKEVFDMSQNLEDNSKFSIERNGDKRITDFIDNISTQYGPAFDASASNEASTFFPNTTYIFVNKVDVLSDKDIDEDNQRYGISVDTYSNKKSTRSNDFDYDNRYIDKTLLSSYTTEVDLFLKAKDYVTSAPLFPATVEWPLKKAQSTLENSCTLLMAIKPLSSELQKLLNAVKLVNQSISDVQGRLCGKKNVVRSAKTEREIAKLVNKVDHFGSSLSTKNFNNQSLDKRHIEIKAKNVAEHDVKFRRRTNGFSLNKLTTPFHKRKSSINNSEVQNSRRNFHGKRKLNERKSPGSGDTERRRSSNSRFNRNLKSLTKSYEMRVKPIRRLIGLKEMKRTTTPVEILSHLIKSNIPSKNNFANGRARNHQENNSKLMPVLNNTPTSVKKDNSMHFLPSDEQDLMQRNVKRAMSREMSGSDEETKSPPVDPQFYREATAYLDILGLLDKKPHVEHATSVVWITQDVTESLRSLIFVTTKFSVSTVTFSPYFTEESTIAVSSTIAEKEEVFDVTESSLYVTVTEFEYGEDYDERNYTGMHEDYEDEENVASRYTRETTTKMEEFISGETTRSVGIAMTSVDYEMETPTEILRYTTVEYQFVTSALITATTAAPTMTSETSEIILLTQSPVTLSAFTITMPTTPPLFYTTELAVISIDEAVIPTAEITTEGITVTSAIAILTEVTETPITIPTIENFTTEPAILLTPFLEGMTDITLRITIPAATETSIKETPALIAQVATTGEEIVESTSTTLATEITRTLLAETISMSLYTFSTVSLLTTTETELTTQVTTPIVPVLTPLTIARDRQTTTPISTFVTERTIAISTVSLTEITTKPATTLGENITAYRTESTAVIARSPTILEKTETLSTSTEVAITTLIPEEEESPVTQIEKTITAEETATTETPTTTETATLTETTTTETSTTTEISTSTEAAISTEIKTTETSTTTEILMSTETTTITKILTMTETLTTTETPTTGTSMASEKPMTKKIPTTIKTTIITETSTPTEILTTVKTPITKGTSSAKTLTPIETKTTTETSTTTEISTYTETTMITEILTMTETLTTTEAPTFTETSTISKIPTTKKIPTTIETTATTEISTSTKILTTLKTPITTETTSVKTLTPIETKATTETLTTTEISTSTETTTITEILMMIETLTTTEIPTSTETSIASEKSTTKKIPTTMKATATTSTPTKILTTLKIPLTEETTSAKTLTSIETKTTTETLTTTEISTSTETTTITEILTMTETLTTTEIPTSTETSIASEKPTIKKISTTMKATATTSTPTKILTTLKIPLTEETTSAKTPTPTIIETPPTTETIETSTITESLKTTEVPMTLSTYITTEFFTTEGTTSSVTMASPETKEFFSISVLTTLATIFATETAESTLTSLIIPVTTTSVKTAIPTLKSTTTTLIINTTLSEKPYTTISSTFLTKGPVTTISFKTAVSTTPLKVTTATPLSLVTSMILTETLSTTLSTILIEETTVSPILTTSASSLETLQTTAVLPIPTTASITETFLTASSIMTDTTESAAVSSTTASTITAEILESTISPVIYFTVTTSAIAKIPITMPVVVDTGTTAYETTSTLVTSTFLTKTIEGTTSPIMDYEETKEYEEYYYKSTKEEIATVTSTAKLTTKERTMTWVTAEEITVMEETTSMTYLPSSTTPFFIETTTEAIPLVTETITLPTITEVTLLIERLTTVIPITMTEEISTLSEATLISTESSTIIKTSTTSTRLVSTIAATTASLLEETVTEIAETTVALLPTTKRPEYATILEAVVTVTLAPFSESILSILITSETPATTSEVIPMLPKTVSEEFTIASTTESPSMIYTTKSSTPLFIETTIQPAVSISTVTTIEMPEAETEYYIAKEPLYEEEYEEYEGYDTGIPTDKWYYYDEYETTTKARMTEADKYTKLSKKKVTSPPFVKGTTMYEVETSEFTSYSTPSESTSIYAVTVTAATSGTPHTYAEEVISTSAVETPASTIVENVTMIGAETEFTASAASEEEKSTMTRSTFGSTEEYTLPSSTVFEIMTEPLEYLTIAPKYTELERWKQIWPVTSPKFITKPVKITASERVSTGTEVEKLTSVFVSSVLTTLTEKETFEVPATMSTTSSEIEGTVKTGYEVTLPILITEEETVPSVTTFIVSETETELVSTTTRKAVEREEKEQLLQRLDDLEQHEREMAEKEEKLKEKESQWDREKEKRKKMMQREKEEAKNITIATGTEGYITITKNLTVLTTAEIEVTPLGLDTSITISSLTEITTVSTEATPFSIIEEITSVTYTTERAGETITEESISTTYATEETKERIIFYVTEETEETIISYTTEKSTPITYSTEEIEEIYITDYVTLMPYITTSLVDLYNVGLASVEITTFYAIEEMYTTSHVSETTPFSITEEIASVTPYTIEKMREAITERSTSTTYATEETEETVISYTPEKSTSMAYTTEEIEEVYITDYVTLTPYVTVSIVDLYNISLIPFETTTPYTIEETYTTSYVTFYSEPLFTSSTITSPITSVTGKFATLPITTFSERFEEISATSITTPTWYTTEETYTATYTDVYSIPLFTSPALMFISTTTSSTLAIGTTTEIEYDEIESLREELRKRERELEEREKLLLEREERLARDIIEFEKYVKECEKKETSIAPSEKSTVLTSLSTPVPPTEKTTVKVQVTTQVKGVTEKKENRTTTKMVTSRTKHVPEETVTREEEEIATKRICLNVLENTTIPLDKRRRDIVTKKICLPYFPEKDEEKKSVGRLSRKPLALQNTRKIRKPRLNLLSDFRRRRRVMETTRKIDNLQLSHHEWLSNETTKSLQHFKGFTRIYGKIRKFPRSIATIIDTQKNTASDFQNGTSLYEQRILDESIFQSTATSMLNSEEYRKRNALFRHDLIPTRKNNFLNSNKASVQKRDVLTIEKNTRFWSKESTAGISNQGITTAVDEGDEYYTVNVLHLSYSKGKQTHEVISAKPSEDELTGILSEPNDDIYVTEFGEGRKITTPYYGIEEEDDVKEEDEAEKQIEEDDEYVEDMIENYMNYEEHEASTRIHDGRFLGDEGKNKKMTERERKLLDQVWPTEKSTTYHLGGTRFWELDFVTEPSALSSTTIDRTETIGVSNTKTTCFDVVLKNERNAEMQPNYNERDIYNNGTRKDGSIEKRSASLKNVTRIKLRTKQPSVVAKELKHDSQNLHEPNYYKQSFEGKRTMKFNDFSRIGDGDSMTAKSRKLCGVNANKSKRQVVTHKNAADKHKKKHLAKSRTSQDINLHSLRDTDNCIVNKKNKDHKTTTTVKQHRQAKTTYNRRNDEKVTRPNIVDREDKSISPSRERKVHNCFNCICDIANVINGIRSILDRMRFPLDEIKALNCSEYKEIQNKIVIPMDSDMEEAREFPQPHYNTESLKGQKYIKLEELEDNFKSELELDNDHDIISLPGLNLNLPCNQDGDGITWLSSVSRPSYTWKRTDGIALFGFVAENGDLELRNVNAKDTGNYTCVMTYISPDNEEPVEITYEVHLQVVTLPRYIVHGENRYHIRSCDENDLDVLMTYLPLKLNSIICGADVCNAYVLTPSCSRSQMTVNVLLVPSHVVKLMAVDPKHCNVFCLKAIQDKLSLILSKNLQIFLGKTLIFRLPHYEQRLVPIVEKSSFARRKRGRTDASASGEGSSNVGLFSSCPAGYGLRDARCVPCNVGTYSEDGISHCKRCPPGTYQPNHGARVCRTCTNPLTKGCSNMLWNSFSAIMVTLASIGAMVSICLLLLWIICCAKKKFFVKRMAGIAAGQGAFEREEQVEEQPLIKDASENDDRQWDSEYRIKRKKGKFYINKKRRKQNDRRRYDKTHVHEDEWGSHRVKNAPVIYPDSYRSHEDYNNHYPKRSYRKGPRLPECDFDT